MLILILTILEIFDIVRIVLELFSCNYTEYQISHRDFSFILKLYWNCCSDFTSTSS